MYLFSYAPSDQPKVPIGEVTAGGNYNLLKSIGSGTENTVLC